MPGAQLILSLQIRRDRCGVFILGLTKTPQEGKQLLKCVRIVTLVDFLVINVEGPSTPRDISKEVYVSKLTKRPRAMGIN